MKNPADITIRLDKHLYGLVVWYMDGRDLTQEYISAPSAIETIEAENSSVVDFGFEGDPPLFI